MKGLQRITTLDRLGAQSSTKCTRTLCVPPTTFLFLWLRNKIRFAVDARTEQPNFSFERVAEDSTR